MEEPVRRYYAIVRKHLERIGIWSDVVRRFPPKAIEEAVRRILERVVEAGVDPEQVDWEAMFEGLIDFSSVDAFLRHYEDVGMIPRSREAMAEEELAYEEGMILSILHELESRPELIEKYRDVLARLIPSTRELTERLDRMAGELEKVMAERDRYRRELERLKRELERIKKEREKVEKLRKPTVRITPELEKKLMEDVVAEAVLEGVSPVTARRWVKAVWPKVSETLRVIEERLERLPPEKAEAEKGVELLRLKEDLVKRLVTYAKARVKPAVKRKIERLAPPTVRAPSSTQRMFISWLQHVKGMTLTEFARLSEPEKKRVIDEWIDYMRRYGRTSA